jgi:F420H(2)-dependent quinone reductase
VKNWILRVGGGLHTRLYRMSGGRIGGKMQKAPVLLLTTTGRKSGKARTQPLLYTRDGEAYAVIASKGGAPAHPLWYLNLQANPVAEITVGAETLTVNARDAEGDERDRLWRAISELYSGYDKYAQKTTRRIPVVVLEPAGADS